MAPGHSHRWWRRSWPHGSSPAGAVVSAIEIGCPANLSNALHALEEMDGIVRAVTDEAGLDAKADVDAITALLDS